MRNRKMLVSLLIGFCLSPAGQTILAQEPGMAPETKPIEIVPLPKPFYSPPYGEESNAVMRIGFARVDVTPSADRPLMGYGYRDEGNDGPLDRLFGRVLLIRDAGNPPAVIVSLDTAILGLKDARKLRQEIATELDTEFARVLLCATHTHSAPYASRGAMETELRPAVMRAVRQAAGLNVPVLPCVQEAPLGLAYNRRVKMPDGKVQNCWGPQEWFSRLPKPAIDPTCTVLCFRQLNGPRTYILWSLGAHPVTLGRTSRLVSGDYPGRACELIEQYVPSARSLFLLGPCADTQPWIATQEDPRELEKVARTAASFVALINEATHPVADKYPGLQVAAGTTVIGNLSVDLTVWRLGSAWIVGCPGELFQELGLELRNRLGGSVIIATLANGGGGYWPTRKAIEEGGYEANAVADTIKAGDSERLIDAIAKLANQIRGQQD